MCGLPGNSEGRGQSISLHRLHDFLREINSVLSQKVEFTKKEGAMAPSTKAATQIPDVRGKKQ